MLGLVRFLTSVSKVLEMAMVNAGMFIFILYVASLFTPMGWPLLILISLAGLQYVITSRGGPEATDGFTAALQHTLNGLQPWFIRNFPHTFNNLAQALPGWYVPVVMFGWLVLNVLVLWGFWLNSRSDT